MSSSPHCLKQQEEKTEKSIVQRSLVTGLHNQIVLWRIVKKVFLNICRSGKTLISHKRMSFIRINQKSTVWR